LYAHYRRHYTPNNAYVVIVGDGDAAALAEQASAAFAGLESGEPIQPPRAPEPPQMGEKRVVVRRAGGALPIVQLAFRSVAATDPTAAALTALSVALAGAGGGGDAASGRSSRLYRALVDTNLATDVDATFQLMKDPYLFWVEASLRPEVAHREVEERILAELERLGAAPLAEAEFARVRRQLLASTAYPSDTVTGRAYRLGTLLSTGAAASIGAWYQALAAVTADEIQRAAAATFRERGRTTGWFIPEDGAP
ncbi:MAG TPA: insulinase family protein, partial [Candidatus Saccharimonadales bacterium]|nr:insulinase family protein [Candidatus Saccharimonadales bacterium]